MTINYNSLTMILESDVISIFSSFPHSLQHLSHNNDDWNIKENIFNFKFYDCHLSCHNDTVERLLASF